MLHDVIALWPGGPHVFLGDYYVYFKYAFSILFLLWAASLLWWPDRLWLLGGTLILAALSWTALDLPLGRPYGLSEEHGGLANLAQPMVAAARGSAAEGWMVRQSNPQPLWSLLLAAVSGFDPENLLAIYPWVPLASMLFMSLAFYWGLGGIREGGGSRSTPSSMSGMSGIAPALAVFFILFLSSSRLSFLQNPGPVWTSLFWSQPRVGFAIGCLAIWIRLLSRSRAPGLVLAGLTLGLASWLEPRVCLLAVAGGLVWVLLFQRLAGWRVSLSLGLGVALLLLWPGPWSPVAVESGLGTWHFAFRGLLAVTLDQGGIFFLALLWLVSVWRDGDRTGGLIICLAGTGFALWVGSLLWPTVAAVVDRTLVNLYLRVLVASAAGLGAHRVVVWLVEKAKELPMETFPTWIRNRSIPATGICLLVALSLPWCFPYWWNPGRLEDMTHIDSIPPVSRQFLALADWIRNKTSPDSVFVAGPRYAPWIAALSGRQVLLIHDDESVPDRPARVRAEKWFMEPRNQARARDAAEQWGLTHFAWGWLESHDEETQPSRIDFRDFESSPLFTRVRRQRRWVRVYEYSP